MEIRCGTARRILLSEPAVRPVTAETQEAEAHVRACDDCRRFLAEQQALSAFVRSRAPRPDAPMAVRRRVFDVLSAARERQTAPSGGYLRLAQVASVLIVATVVGAAAWFVGQPSADERWRDRLRAFAEDHVRATEATAVTSSDAAEVRAWLAVRLGFTPHVPAMGGAVLEGARLCKLGGRDAAVVCYRVDGEQVSLYIMPADQSDPSALAPAQLVAATDWGQGVVAWHGAGLLHALVGGMADARLRELARYCLDLPADHRRF